jgi:hypothetical protein
MGNITSLFTKKSSTVDETTPPVDETTPPVDETTPREDYTTNIPFTNQMDDNNKSAVEIWANEGVDKAIEHMCKHPETGAPMDYATMRYYYG